MASAPRRICQFLCAGGMRVRPVFRSPTTTSKPGSTPARSRDIGNSFSPRMPYARPTFTPMNRVFSVATS